LTALKAIVFDLDDTLYPERAYVLSGFRAVGSWVEEQLRVQAESATCQFRQLFDAGARTDTFDQWVRWHGFPDHELVPQMVEVYRRHRPTITPYTETEVVLERLRRNYLLALLSDGDLDVQQRKLEQLRLARFFDHILFTDAYGPGYRKPSTLPFRTVLEHLNVNGHESVYVADNPTKDFLGARRSGMFTIRVCRPEGVYSQLEPISGEYAPDEVVSTLGAVLDWIVSRSEDSQ
jgi:putative hydrolase of the HAD superfamily